MTYHANVSICKCSVNISGMHKPSALNSYKILCSETPKSEMSDIYKCIITSQVYNSAKFLAYKLYSKQKLPHYNTRFLLSGSPHDSQIILRRSMQLLPLRWVSEWLIARLMVCRGTSHCLPAGQAGTTSFLGGCSEHRLNFYSFAVLALAFFKFTMQNCKHPD